MLERLIILSAILFCIGLYGALTRRHIVAVLISVEIMFNAVNVAFVAFARYVTPAALRATGEVSNVVVERTLLAGQTFAIFIIVIAAAEVALGLALVIAMVRRTDSVDISEANLMRH
jgi:NADH:ubiquinone oxidoreductase subunit K